MSATAKTRARPAITISETDAQRLTSIALQMEASVPAVAQMLLDELERAQVRPDRSVPTHVIGMNSKVEFIDEARGGPRSVQLVYPAEADISVGKISVVTPIGAALIGLKEGQSINWPDRDGRSRILKILRVTRDEVHAQ